ncbi:MAG: adenylate/guanylate cyclase domain-containing protein [Myxococcales bacterium]|nr:adenylate/guanylate cyclase domain-containing protein [Myxococcales bacterium]
MTAHDPQESEESGFRRVLEDPQSALELAPDELVAVVQRAAAIAEEHEELLLLHEVTLEHSTDIEGQLAAKVEEIEALVRELEVRNGFIRKVFGRYITDEVVATLLESPEALELGGEKRAVTILMSDLRGFSSLCERLSPEQVVRTLNTYLGAMAEVISAHQGTINEFIGDAILAVFGAPIRRSDDAERAVACAIAMQEGMAAVNAEITASGLPRLEMGIGVHTGEVVVGNIGSTKRAKYGLVGSAVNLTSRIESYTVGGQVLISDPTAKILGDRLITGDRFAVTPKGIREPLTIHEVLGLRGTYARALPRHEIELVELDPLPVEIALIDGKDVGDERHAAVVVALALEGAVMITSCPLEPRDNLKLLILGDDGAPRVDDVYGKVARVDERVFVRFTSVPPASLALLRALLAGRAPVAST